jgi:hypothetical protein
VKKPVKKKVNAKSIKINPAPAPAARVVGCSTNTGYTPLTGLVDWPRHEMFRLRLAALS